MHSEAEFRKSICSLLQVFFFIITCSFSVFLLNILYYCLKVYMNLLCSCLLYIMVLIFYPFTQIFIIGHKGKTIIGVKGVYNSYKKISMLHFCNWKKKCTLKQNFCSGKFVNPLWPIIKIWLAVLGFILNKLPFQRYEVPTMLLEKVSIHTDSPFVH
jgi:hypothetical protein